MASVARPRVGFVGLGWIGLARMDAIVQAGLIEPVALVDPSDAAVEAAMKKAPGARRLPTLEALFGLGLDGVVIATPSAQHAGQAIAALDAGLAVFCQKPLGRSAAEVAAVVAAARQADRLIGVDLSYRETGPAADIRRLVQAGALGDVHAVDLMFHNAYGPDKPWFRDPAQSGGGCVTDLGVHLVDLALWTLGWPRVVRVEAQLSAGGRPLRGRDLCEDHGFATLHLETGCIVRLACSWNLPAGRDAIISAAFYGTGGGAMLRNLDGSFHDLVGERLEGTRTSTLSALDSDWGGRAIGRWCRLLAAGGRFDPSATELSTVAEVLDGIYAAGAMAKG